LLATSLPLPDAPRLLRPAAKAPAEAAFRRGHTPVLGSHLFLLGPAQRP
jgi:hypothetical protein